MEPLIIESDIGASVKTTRNQFLSYNYTGTSVKTTHNQLLFYDYILHHNCTYPYIRTAQNGEYFTINIPNPIYDKIIKKETSSLSTNPTEDINLLKYIINKLY